MASDRDRIVDEAERIDRLPTYEDEAAALAELQPGERRDVALAGVMHATLNARILQTIVDALPDDAPTTPADDPLLSADEQMTDHFSEALHAMNWRLLRVTSGEDDGEVQATVERLLAEDPQYLELAETVGTFMGAHTV